MDVYRLIPTGWAGTPSIPPPPVVPPVTGGGGTGGGGVTPPPPPVFVWPTSANTGPRVSKPASGSSNHVTTPYTTSAGGEVHTGIWFDTWVNVKHPNVQFIDCWITGQGYTTANPTTAGACVRSRSGLGTKLSYCDIGGATDVTAGGATGGGVLAGFEGYQFSIDHCEIHDVIDHIDQVTSGSQAIFKYVVEYNYMHSLVNTYSALQGGPAHSDCFQIDGGGSGSSQIIRFNSVYASVSSLSDITDSRNTVDGLTTSGYNHGINITANVGDVYGLQVYNNWFRGGRAGVNVPLRNSSYASGIKNTRDFSLHDNIFGGASNTPDNYNYAFAGGGTGRYPIVACQEAAIGAMKPYGFRTTTGPDTTNNTFIDGKTPVTDHIWAGATG